VQQHIAMKRSSLRSIVLIATSPFNIVTIKYVPHSQHRQRYFPRSGVVESSSSKSLFSFS
jgi:hypothetical protein